MARHVGSPMRHETPSEDELQFIHDHYGPRAKKGRLTLLVISERLRWPYWRVHAMARGMGLCFQAHFRPGPDKRLEPAEPRPLPPTPQALIAAMRAQIEQEMLR